MNQFIENDKIITRPNIDLVATGKKIQSLRETKGWSVKEFANFLELEAVQGIYHWQYGKNLPQIENLLILSELFDMPIKELLVFKPTSA